MHCIRRFKLTPNPSPPRSKANRCECSSFFGQCALLLLLYQHVHSVCSHAVCTWVHWHPRLEVNSMQQLFWPVCSFVVALPARPLRLFSRGLYLGALAPAAGGHFNAAAFLASMLFCCCFTSTSTPFVLTRSVSGCTGTRGWRSIQCSSFFGQYALLLLLYQHVHSVCSHAVCIWVHWHPRLEVNSMQQLFWPVCSFVVALPARPLRLFSRGLYLGALAPAAGGQFNAAAFLASMLFCCCFTSTSTPFVLTRSVPGALTPASSHQPPGRDVPRCPDSPPTGCLHQDKAPRLSAGTEISTAARSIPLPPSVLSIAIPSPPTIFLLYSIHVLLYSCGPV